ncbi:MAG: leucine-rich repeat protein [Clostridia bacterium]|nr:leucine-rich repeat protein [Clostridia bacterium]
MHFFKWVSVLTFIAVLFAMLPATVAEDEFVIEIEETNDEELEFEVTDGEFEGLDAFDESAVSLEEDSLESDDLEDNLLVYENEEQENASLASNASAEFEIDEEGTLKRYGGFATNVVIPYGVINIGDYAFAGYTGMESVSIPNSVTYIGMHAFDGCAGLKTVTIPESVETIYFSAFSHCTSLTNVTLPNTMKELYSWAFSDCTSLRDISIPSSIIFDDYCDSIFSGCTSLTSIQLPPTMTELPNGMFSDCDSLDNLDFLSGITIIGDSALSDCDGLKNITIPGSVTSIGSNAFANCKNLEGVTIHSGVTFIDRTAFDRSENVVIRGTTGSTAENYAHGVNIPFNAPVVTFDENVINNYTSIEGKYQDYEGLILYINQSYTLNVVQKPSDLARALSWSSSNSNIATVDQNGTVKAVSPGLVTITAATADGKGKAAQIKVVVPETTSLFFSWDEPIRSDEIKNLELKLLDTRRVYVFSEIPYKDKTEVDMPITLTSSDQSIVTAQLTEDNKVTLNALKLGKATITATTPDGGRASLEVEVIRPDAESIKIDQSGPIKLYPGQKCTLTTTIEPTEAEAKLKWDSWDTDVATVDQNGTVTAVKPGETRINVKTDNDLDAYIYIYVLTPPKKITLSKTKATLAVGDTLTLKKTLMPEDAETNFTWLSSKPAVATVSNKGKVTALKPGRAKITVKTDNGKKASAVITVKPAPKKVRLNVTRVTLGVKKKLTLKATLSPSGAYTTLTWKSSKPAVASVSKKGVVTARKPGTAVITVRTHNGKTAKVTIKVK